MIVDGWRYYNHAAIPTCGPNESPNLSPIIDGTIWKSLGGEGKPLFARWTDKFDCGYETNWWYVIKDTAFDLNTLKAKRRYEINKGIKAFDVRKIENAGDYSEHFFEIACDAYKDYPIAYRPIIERSSFVASVNTWSAYDVFGAFSKEDGLLKAWALLRPHEKYSNFEMLKSVRFEEKKGVNAALINGILEYYNRKLDEGYFICDGARNISHETAFQDYLEKYFGFRKAYCELHIEYAPFVRFVVMSLFPFRKVLQALNRFRVFHNVSSVLKMEEIARQG